VFYDFTDAELQGKFEFSEELKAKDAEEYKARRSRRNGLNLRLARICKAAVALFESKATYNDMIIIKDEANSELATVLNAGPKQLMGNYPTVRIFNKSVAPVIGATITPTISGLAKLADERNKLPEPITKDDVESATRLSPDTKDFSAIINEAILVIRSMEGKFTNQQKTQLKTLLTEIEKYAK
jgi:hypothetical protein